MAKNFKVLKTVELEEFVEYELEIRTPASNNVLKKVKSKIRSMVDVAIVKYLMDGEKVLFNPGVAKEYKQNKTKFSDIDEKRILLKAGKFSANDYYTLSDFLRELSDEVDYGDCVEDWMPVKRIAEMNIKDKMNSNASEIIKNLMDDIMKYLNSLSDEHLSKEMDLVKVTNKRFIETREYTKTGKTNDIKVEKEQREIVEDSDKRVLEDYSKEDKIEVFLNMLDIYKKDDTYTIGSEAVDIFTSYIDENKNTDFKVFCNRGLKVLGIENTLFKNIYFSNTEMEELILNSLKEVYFGDKKFLDKAGNVRKLNSGPIPDSISHKEQPSLAKKVAGITCTDTREKNLVRVEAGLKFALLNPEKLMLDTESIETELKLLACIIAFRLNEKGVSLEKLKEILSFDRIKKSLFLVDINYIVKTLFDREKMYQNVKTVLPKEPKDYYPETRRKHRHFVLHAGPTNSGKTYQSLEKFKKSSSGIYLAPLRLLALEVQEKMILDGIKCSLVTGEEEQLLVDSTHVCSTIEKANFNMEYDIAVIDEAQMLEDAQRGCAWTAAILGINADEVHVCMANYAVDMVIRLIGYCGDTYELIEHNRDTELIVHDEEFDIETDLEPGDAVVAFSKRKVLNLAAKINKDSKHSCSVLFGALPYQSRKKQFENFATGKSDILVTTDAIGMGVNLAIKRVIFMEDSKFDGKEDRYLTTSETLQIAGRAGRRGIYNEGHVFFNSYDLEEIYEDELEDINKVYVGLNHYLTKVDGKLEDIIFAWQKLDFKAPFKKADISQQLSILDSITHIPLTEEEKFKAIFLPVNPKSDYEMELLKQYLRDIARKVPEIHFPTKPQMQYNNELRQLEEFSKGIDLYYSVSKAFGLLMDIDKVYKKREETCNRINKLLLADSLDVSRCSECGAELEWDSVHYKCSSCFYASRRSYYNPRWDYEWDDDFDDDDWDFEDEDDDYII